MKGKKPDLTEYFLPSAVAQLSTASFTLISSSTSWLYRSKTFRALSQSFAARACSKTPISILTAVEECNPRRTTDMYVLPGKTVAKLLPSSCWFWSGSNIVRRNRSNIGKSFNNTSHSLDICSKPKGTSRFPRNSIQDKLDLGIFCILDALRHATVAISFDWDFRKSREDAVSVCWLKSFRENGPWVELSSEVTAELRIGISTSGRQW